MKKYLVTTISDRFLLFPEADMDAGEDQNTGNTNGNPQTSGNSRAPQIAHMSLYERQAVQVCMVVRGVSVSPICGKTVNIFTNVCSVMIWCQNCVQIR